MSMDPSLSGAVPLIGNREMAQRASLDHLFVSVFLSVIGPITQARVNNHGNKKDMIQAIVKDSKAIAIAAVCEITGAKLEEER